MICSYCDTPMLRLKYVTPPPYQRSKLCPFCPHCDTAGVLTFPPNVAALPYRPIKPIEAP